MLWTGGVVMAQPVLCGVRADVSTVPLAVGKISSLLRVNAIHLFPGVGTVLGSSYTRAPRHVGEEMMPARWKEISRVCMAFMTPYARL